MELVIWKIPVEVGLKKNVKVKNYKSGKVGILLESLDLYQLDQMLWDGVTLKQWI